VIRGPRLPGLVVGGMGECVDDEGLHIGQNRGVRNTKAGRLQSCLVSILGFRIFVGSNSSGCDQKKKHTGGKLYSENIDDRFHSRKLSLSDKQKTETISRIDFARLLEPPFFVGLVTGERALRPLGPAQGGGGLLKGDVTFHSMIFKLYGKDLK